MGFRKPVFGVVIANGNRMTGQCKLRMHGNEDCNVVPDSSFLEIVCISSEEFFSTGLEAHEVGQEQQRWFHEVDTNHGIRIHRRNAMNLPTRSFSEANAQLRD